MDVDISGDLEPHLALFPTQESLWNLELVHSWSSLEPTGLFLKRLSKDQLLLHIIRSNGSVDIVSLETIDIENIGIGEQKTEQISTDALTYITPIAFRSMHDLAILDNQGQICILNSDAVIERLTLEKKLSCMTIYDDACMKSCGPVSFCES